MVADSDSSVAAPITGDELGGMLREWMKITERLQQTHETLQQEMARLRTELASKDRELERRRRLSALGELAAGVAHEVRNPLGAIRLYTGLLRSECKGVVGASTMLEKIDAGVHAIDCVVQDTLALTPRANRIDTCVVRSLIDDAHDACRRALDEKRIRLTTCFEEQSLEVRVDVSAIQRVLVNLITNAAEASAIGATIEIVVETVGKELIQVRVLDRGPGLSAEVLDRIFDPFFTTKAQGTGLGLTIAHRVVEAHDGRLAASNRTDGGAEFTVTLPVAPLEPGNSSNRGAEKTSAA